MDSVRKVPVLARPQRPCGLAPSNEPTRAQSTQLATEQRLCLPCARSVRCHPPANRGAVRLIGSIDGVIGDIATRLHRAKRDHSSRHAGNRGEYDKGNRRQAIGPRSNRSMYLATVALVASGIPRFRACHRAEYVNNTRRPSARANRRLLACFKLPVGRSNLLAGQSSAEGTSQARAYQATAAGPLGHDARPSERASVPGMVGRLPADRPTRIFQLL